MVLYFGFHLIDSQILRSIILTMYNSYTKCGFWKIIERLQVHNQFFLTQTFYCPNQSLVLALRPGQAGTRAKSSERYGSGKLHPGQLFWGNLPFFPPPLDVPTLAVRCLLPQRHDRSLQRKEIRCPVVILTRFRLLLKFRDLLHAASLRHGTQGYTSPPKEGILRIFSS